MDFSNKGVFIEHLRLFCHKNKNFLFLVSITFAFIIGLLLPSPLFRHGLISSIVGDSDKELVDTTNMLLPGGGVYNGTIIKGTNTRHGYGSLTTTDGSVYEGNWREDKLSYGQRTTSYSVYNGKFNEDLQNDGFGIIQYTEEYINDKKSEGKNDHDIVVTYIGNWSNNNKQGLGRSIKLDGSMDFGQYNDGVYQIVSNTNYEIGAKTYGIDVSHYQTDINWDNLALYCDKDGNITDNTSSAYMQPVFFVYIKATEGATIKDDTYNVRSVEAERHGIIRGAYHMFHLESDIDKQIKNFLETANWTVGDLPPALDVELETEIAKHGKEKLISSVSYWLKKVESQLHVRPVIYTRESIKEKYLNDGQFEGYRFWIAKYDNNMPNFQTWMFWQYTEKGSANGCTGKVDIDLFNGTYKSLENSLRK